MITAHKSRYFETLFRLYNRHYLLRRAFRTVYLRGEVDPPGPQPALYVMNHCSWWDGLIIYDTVARYSSRSHYMMMEEQQLAKYRFFRRLGAFSIDKSSLRSVKNSLQYALRLLTEGHSVWIFPQGDIAHLELRPLGFLSGAGLLLAQHLTAQAIPVTFYPTFGLHQKPEASIWFGAPLAGDRSGSDRRTIARELEAAVTAQLDRHRQDTIDGLRGMPGEYRPLFLAGRSVNETFDRWKPGARRLWP